MVWHKIQDQFETVRVYSGEQRVEIDHRAEQRIDAGIIANVIAKILHRRRKYWREPDRINAKLSEIGKPTDDARQIADAIAIAVLKRARVDLINDSGFPPSVGHDDFKIPQLSLNSTTAHDFSTPSARHHQGAVHRDVAVVISTSLCFIKWSRPPMRYQRYP